MTRDPDSGSGRAHRDYAGRSITSPGPGRDLDATDDDAAPDSGRFGREFTPVDALGVRIASLEAVAIRHDAQLAESATVQASREWQQMRTDVDQALADARLCREQQERAQRWAPVVKWVKGIGAGGVVTALVWAVVKIGDNGAAREAAARDAQIMRTLVDDVRDLQIEAAADHALLLQHLNSRPGTP